MQYWRQKMLFMHVHTIALSLISPIIEILLSILTSAWVMYKMSFKWLFVMSKYDDFSIEISLARSLVINYVPKFALYGNWWTQLLRRRSAVL